MHKNLFFDLTNPQKSIWNTEEVFKGTAINNICTSGIIYEKVDIELLKKAINLVVKEHDSFRIRLVLRDGKVQQYISDYLNFNIEVKNIHSRNELNLIQKEAVNHKFDIIDSDLFTFKIIILNDVFTCVILTVNHIIADSWSLGITIQEILKNYHNLKNKNVNNSQIYSYKDYISSEYTYRKSPKFEKDKKFWENTFCTIPEQATFPSIINNSNNMSSHANRLEFKLNDELVNAIKTYCNLNHFSIFSFFMALYSIYIGRTSNVSDFVIGTPILNRANFKEKHTTGMFVNTAPIRINNFNNVSFIDFTNSISKNILRILRHQKYSYNEILEGLRNKYENLPNLYNVMVSYQITKAFDENFGNYETNWTFNNHTANDVDIHIYDINDTGSLSISYDYLTRKYTSKDIIYAHSRIVNMIQQILGRKNILTNDIEIITDNEKKLIVYDFNNTCVYYPNNKTIIDLFESQVKKTPHSFALFFADQKLTYNELNEKVNNLAHYLKNKNAQIVAILLDKSVELIVSILAVLKSGGCYIPISPEYPQNRINHILNASNCNLLITSKDSNIAFKNCIYIDEINNLSEYDNSNLNIPIDSESLAYIIYTSGSTGNPKGVTISHSSLLNYIYWANMFYCKNKPTNFPLYSSIGFDLTITSIFTPLINGGTIFAYNDSDIFLTLKDIFENSKSDVVKLTPAHLSLLNDFDFSKTNVKTLIVGGDLLLPEICKRVTHKFKNIHIYNEYGPTETTVGCMIYEYSENSCNYASVPIGVPISNTQIYILDNRLKPVPIGCKGEIYISGAGLSKGYLNLPDKTNSSFVPNPYVKNSLMYKTGDIGVFNSDGDIICLGRSDNQIKIRGFRIELGEIEKKIQELPFIGSCVVVKKTSSELHDYLCAYYTARELVDPSILKKYLASTLPRYMMPNIFIQMNSLPYTTNGKIDRKKLPEPEFKKTKRNIIPPRNAMDKKIISILEDLFNANYISIDDDFFELGGDSLLAINLCTRIRSNLNVDILVKDILENPIIKDFSDIINKKTNLNEKLLITPVKQADFYELSSNQKSIYLSTQMSGKNSILYNSPGGVIFNGIIDIQKLENCFNILINRHESLRTYFEIVDGNIVQKILNNFNFKLEILENKDFKNINTIFKDFVKPFDLSKAPLFRAQLVKFANDKIALFIDMHHIISDGMSLAIFTEELCKLYNNKKLDDINITYKDFVHFENQLFLNGSMKEAENYWTNLYKDEIPVLNLPTSFARPAVHTFKGAKVHSKIDASTYTKLINMSKQYGITPYMILLACYYILLYKYTSQEDIVVGSPIVGREINELNRIIGMFVNTLPLREKIDSSLSFKDFVLNVKKNVLQAYSYQSYPLNELVNKLNIKRDTSRNPLFDTMFVFQNNGYADLKFDNIDAQYFIPDTDIAKFDLTVEAVPDNNELNLSFEYATSIFDEDFIKNMANHYLNILTTVINNISTKIANICILSEYEKNKILYDFNNTYSDYPRNKTIVELFEEQVEKNPNNTAVVFENESLTYRELNEKSNQLANYLISKNVTNNDVIAIRINRSFNLIIAIYAVIKSGATFALVDTSFPDERAEYIIKDCNAKLCIDKTTFSSINLLDFSRENKNCSLKNDLCIIYTSGSTGNPKGVLLQEIGFINLVYAFDKEMNISKYKNILGLANVSFDMFSVELFCSTLLGNTLILASEEEQKNPIAISNLIVNNHVEFFIATPSRVELLLTKECNNPLKNVKAFQLGGEIFSIGLYKKLVKNTNAKIFNGYGPTEITACCTNKLVTSEKITIGKPISNIQAYICDNNLNLLPTGIIGEICIAGIGVSKGYLNNPEKTLQNFVKNPFGNGYLYKTGDFGKYISNGEIEYIGRIDNQIKIRGLRIELGEIESKISQFSGIKKVKVIKNNINNRDVLSAYFTANKNVNINELKISLSNALPQYMIPTYFTVLKEFPYTHNGKLDVKSLPIPCDSLNENNYVKPETELQKILVNIWEKLLNIKNIGIYDNFFELGGDSLLAMSLNVELLKISDKIKYSDIFHYPTIALLEKKIYSNNNKLFFNKIENLSDNYVDILDNTTKRIKITKYHPQHTLLTGSTGFLGIHILEQLVKNEKGNIYCIIRDGKNITAKEKLLKKLHYYFGNKYDELIDNKIIVLTGNVSLPNFGLDSKSLHKLNTNIDIVINCAANVSHYGNYKDFYNSNVKSVQYIIDYCKSNRKKLYHISTTSISGSGADLDLLYKKHRKKNIVLKESNLYVGQIIDNVYARSKFEAENSVLNAISNGLDGYILRMGNLMPRYYDGKFQENILSNSFINKLLSFIDMGVIPNYLLKHKLEFTPVDYASNAIYHIITNYTNDNRIFHLYNHNYVTTKKFTHLLKKCGLNIDVLDEDTFVNRLKEMLYNSSSKSLIKNLIDDLDKNLHFNYDIDIIIKSNYTIRYLKKTGFKWPRISKSYLIQFIELLRSVI